MEKKNRFQVQRGVQIFLHKYEWPAIGCCLTAHLSVAAGNLRHTTSKLPFCSKTIKHTNDKHPIEFISTDLTVTFSIENFALVKKSKLENLKLLIYIFVRQNWSFFGEHAVFLVFDLQLSCPRLDGQITRLTKHSFYQLY